MYRNGHVPNWSYPLVSTICSSLLVTDGRRRLQLVAVLREVKYLLIRNMEEIPESASQLYANNDTLLMYVAHLDLTVAWYNKIRETVLEVEYPIIEAQLQAIDTQLQQAEQTLDWQTEGTLTLLAVNFAAVLELT